MTAGKPGGTSPPNSSHQRPLGDFLRPLVLALPRGGVPVAAEVARALKAPLDVLVVRKIGVPGHPETGVGAIVGEDPPLFDSRSLQWLGLSEDALAPTVAA